MIISNKSILLYFVSLLLFVLLGFGISYAFFGSAANGNESVSYDNITTPNYYLTLNDYTALNITDATSSVFYKKIITVRNDTGSTLTYNLVWQNVKNGIYNHDNLKYEVFCKSYSDYQNKTISGSCSNVRLKKSPNSGKYQSIINDVSISSGIIQEYTIYLYYAHNLNTSSFRGQIVAIMDDTIPENSDYASDTFSRMILKNSDVTSSIIARGNPTFTSAATTDEGIYATSDQTSTSFYYRGAVTNNYVSFANKIWRIVRINGDGTIRLILNDYARDTNNNEYWVSYNTASSCTASTTITQAVDCSKYGTGTYSSTSMKTYVDTWYSNNITGTSDSHVATGKYCNDYSYTGTGSSYTTFGGWQRIANLKVPSLSCTAPSGYTGGGTNIVQAKVGLMSADELSIAGGLWGTVNTNVYYYLDNSDWITLTADEWYGPSNAMTMIRYYNDINNLFMTYAKKFRPVINLNAGTIVYAQGTLSNPYTVI